MLDVVKKWLKGIDKKEAAKYVLLTVFIVMLLKLLFGGLFGYSLVVIENGPKSSMWPTYDKGDLFLIHHVSPEKIHLGDVIVYESATAISKGTLIIHRVVNVTIIHTEHGTRYYFRVSGDNPITNNYVDPYNSTTTLIPYEAVKGKTVLLIPKVGYVRLWLAENQVIRIILIVVLLGLGLYLIFGPEKTKNKEADKKEKEKDEYETRTLTEEIKKTKPVAEKENKSYTIKERLVFIRNTIMSWLKKKWKNIFGIKKNRIKFFIIMSVILLLIILIPLTDELISYKGLKTGIVDIDNLNVTYNPFGDTSIVYVSFTIHYQDDGTWTKVFKSFTVYGIQNDEVIATMKWYSFYQKEGELEIGGSLVIPATKFNATLPLTIKINYTIHYRFGSDTNDSFSKTFSPPFLNILGSYLL